MDSTPDPILLIKAQPTRMRRLMRRFDRVFLFTVFLPTLLAAIYYGAVASDVYISESRFVVRSPQRQIQTGIGALLQGTAFSRSQDDTYSVHDYILSRDALRELDGRLNFRSAFSDDHIDFVNRFPGLDWDRSFESLYKHYTRHVSIDYDTVSSISVLRVRAYTAEQAGRINDALLDLGERLINSLNVRIREDLIKGAQDEVHIAEERAKAAAVALSAFRADRSVFDPDRQSALQLQGVARLQDELLATEAQLAQIRSVAPNNAQVATLASRADTLRKSIDAETAKILGKGSSLNAKSPVYDRLVLERTFADRQLGTALASLDSARSEAQRQQLYLERLVQPNKPDMALEPRRLRSVLMVFAVGMILWGVVSLVLASIREHTE